MNLEDLGVAELASKIESSQVSPVDAAIDYLRWIEHAEPQINSWQYFDGDCLLSAAKEREMEVRSSRNIGPLHGVPVGVKDIFYTKGISTTMGSSIYKDFVPTTDATVVSRLKKAGAIVMGKTVTTEFATFDPAITRNPWNLGCTPGGSSSGSAAAVSGRMCPAAVGSQSVGSIGRPAAFCGVVGFMPTAAKTFGEGVFPVAWSLDHTGAFARTVDDVAIMYEVMSATPAVKRGMRKKVALGMISGFFKEKLSDETWQLHIAITEKLSENGMELVELSLPDIFECQSPTIQTILAAEIAAVHAEIFTERRADYSPQIRSLIEVGRLLPATDYLRALRVRRRYQRELKHLFDQCDVLISPGALGSAPQGLDYTGDPVLSAGWTLADFPTLSLPATLDSDDMPIGIQLTGPPNADLFLLEVGKLVEEVIGFDYRPTLKNSLVQGGGCRQ